MIEVFCVCGKRYAVPPDKAGKKLQCRRCGNVQRVPRPGKGRDEAIVVPFAVPDDGEADDEASAALLAAPDESPLDLRDPVHRCPACGLQDDASVVVCVRCGYDWRVGRRLDDAYEASETSGRLRLAAAGQGEAARLERLAYAALTPAGVVLGPWVVARSLPLGKKLATLEPGGPASATVLRARILGALGCVAWLVVAGVVGAGWRRERSGVAAVHDECLGRLERVGAAVRERLAAAGRFPPEAVAWPDGLEGLTRPGGAGQGPAAVGPDDLRCPRAQGLYAYRRREAELLTPEVAGDYLLLWDPEPHPDDRGRLTLRALRADGRIDLFLQPGDLEAATRRAPFRGEPAAPGPPKVPPAATESAGQGPPPAPPAEGAQARRVEAFLRFAEEVDDRDPDFSQGLTVELERFTVKVGVPAIDLLPGLLRGREEGARRQAARMLARVDLPPTRALGLARELLKDPDAEVRFGAGMTLRRHGAPEWLAVVAGVVEEARTEGTRQAALAWLGREARAGTARTRAVLEVAAARRAALGVKGVEAVVPLPVDALPFVAPLVADPVVGREARAALFSAREAGATAVIGLLGGPDPAVRRAAFSVLDQLRAGGVLPVDAYLRHVSAELLPEVRAEAMTALATGQGPPDPALLAWALDQVRPGGSAGRLRALCDGVLVRAGAPGPGSDEGLARLVDDLTTGGDHGPVLASLRAPSRALDERVDVLLSRALGRVRDPATRGAIVEVVGARVTEGALRVAAAAADDADEDVRIEALGALLEANAVRGDDLRREVARVVAQRLRVETSPRAFERLYALASGGLYCALGVSQGEDEHRCTPALVRALEPLARKGDRAAIRALTTHPNERTLQFLLALYESAQGEARLDIGSALAGLSGISLVTTDAAAWKKALTPLPPQALTALAALAQADARAVRQRLEQGTRRRAELEAAGRR